MNLKYFSKNKAVAIAIISFALGALIYNYSSVIFQEGDPWPQIKGIVQLNFTDKNIIKLSGEENRYMTKSKDGAGIIKYYMKDKGYDFIEQMGSGYFFESNTGESAVTTHRYYSRYYSLWSITENLTSKDTILADELKECLPKSDMASYERCNELLTTIRNFGDCVNAGFAIMKSNPPQCATPDNRTFIDETNSTWDVVLTNLNNCEVESVFQTHSKLVTLKLKNGNKVTAYEPRIDDVMNVVAELKGRCGNIRMATE